MEVVINLFCYSFAYAGHSFEFPEPGPGNRSRRAEMAQQRLLAARADSVDFIERGAAQGLRSLGAVSTDGKPMRFVAQPLQEIEDGVARVERERRSSWHEEAFPPGIAVRPLRDPDDCDAADAEFFEDTSGDIELPLAAVDQDQIGPGPPVALRILFDGAGEAAHQDLAHHRIIITTRSPHPPPPPPPPPPAGGGGQKEGSAPPPPPGGGGGWGGGRRGVGATPAWAG